jgi:hypothetical protein
MMPLLPNPRDTNKRGRRKRRKGREEVRGRMVGQGSSRTMWTQRQLIATRTTAMGATMMTRVTVKKNNSNQKMEERRRLGQMSTSIGIGCQVEPLPRGGREKTSLK